MLVVLGFIQDLSYGIYSKFESRNSNKETVKAHNIVFTKVYLYNNLQALTYLIKGFKSCIFLFRIHTSQTSQNTFLLIDLSLIKTSLYFYNTQKTFQSIYTYLPQYLLLMSFGYIDHFISPVLICIYSSYRDNH